MQGWAGENNFIVPSFGLIEQVLIHILQEQAKASIVVPVWEGQVWWLLLLTMAVAWWPIPGGRNMFLPGPSGFVELWKNKDWQFAAVRVNTCGKV
jgi:hypothetical protein